MKKILLKLNNFFERYGLLLSILLAIVASILYATLSLVRHMHFQSGAFDLGIFDQAVWQYAHFLYPFNTIKMRMILGDHLTLTLPILAPLYWIWPNAKMLLAFQAVWISFSSVAIYLYTRKRGFSGLESLILSFLYLFFFGIQFGVFFDFHPVILGVGLLAWVLYFWESEKWKWFGVFVVLLLLTQENMGLALFAVAITWFFQGKRRKLAIMMGILGVVASAIAFKTIPFFSNAGLEYIPHLPTQPLQYITELFDDPQKRQVWLYSFSWYSFIPLFSPGALLAYLSDVSQYFLTGPAYARMWSPFMHHRAILSVYLLIGTADVLLFLKNRKIPTVWLTIIMLLVALVVNFHFHFAVDKLAKRDFWQQDSWIADNYAVMKHIPPTASLAAQQSLVPHVSERKQIYLIYPRQNGFAKNSPCGQKSCWWLDFAGKPQYLFVDTHPGEWLTMTLESITNFSSAVNNMEKTGAITLVYRQGEARLYKVNYTKLHQLGI